MNIIKIEKNGKPNRNLVREFQRTSLGHGVRSAKIKDIEILDKKSLQQLNYNCSNNKTK